MPAASERPPSTPKGASRQPTGIPYCQTGDAASSSCGTHMRIRLSDPQLVPSLLTFLRAQVHVTAAHVTAEEIEVSQLGSLHAAGRRLELGLLLQIWRSAHGNVQTRILD